MKVASTHNELWQTTHNWLTFSGHAVNKKYCREEISTHPDYPSLTAVTDFLDAGGMAYHAVQADASYIHEFNYPLLAHIKQLGHEYLHIINTASDWDKQKDITSQWSGVCIYPEKNSRWVNKENEAYQQKNKEEKLRNALAVAIAGVLFTITVINNPVQTFIIFGLLSIGGLVISILATGTELGVQNSLVKQVCGAVSNGGCDKVLKSNYAKAVAGLTTGDIGTLYFAAQFIGFLCSSFYPVLFNTIVLLSLPGVLVAGWSIYTQSVKIRQWCALCLGIVAILLLKSSLSGYIFYATGLDSMFSLDALMIYASIALLVSLIFLPVKKLLKADRINGHKLAELKKWKMDVALFITQWQNEREVNTTLWENDLIIGNPDAAIKITVACNPYCGPCAKAHKELDEMLERYKNKLCVRVRWLCNSKDATDKRTIAVKAFSQKVIELKNNDQISQMLSDWFETMNYDKWITKWKAIDDRDVHAILQQHHNWVEQSDIAFTPTFFLNGKKLPGRYGLAELKILLPQLENLFVEQQLINNL